MQPWVIQHRARAIRKSLMQYNPPFVENIYRFIPYTPKPHSLQAALQLWRPRDMAFRITDHRGFFSQSTSNVDLWCFFVASLKKLLNKQSSSPWFEMLRRSRDVTAMSSFRWGCYHSYPQPKKPCRGSIAVVRMDRKNDLFYNGNSTPLLAVSPWKMHEFLSWFKLWALCGR